MPREWTEEQKEAARARLAAARAAKQAKKQEAQEEPKTNTSPQTEQTQEPQQPVTSVDPSVADLTRMVLELKKQLETTQAVNQAYAAGQASMGQSQVQGGRLVGTTEKFSVNKDLYEDPRPRLLSETRLRRIAFDANYELDWDISVTSYETKDGVQMKEPKFTLKLNQVVLDDDGEPTDMRIGKAQLIFFEDPATAIVVANQNGIAVDEQNEAQFLNNMRYIRARDWLFECFWPAKVDRTQSSRQTMAIGGQVVDTWRVSTEGSAKIDFDSLGNKLRA